MELSVGLSVYIFITVTVLIIVQGLMTVVTNIRKRNEVERQLSDIVLVPGHWFWGNVKQFRDPKRQLALVRERKKKYGPIVRLRVGPFRALVQVMGEEYIKPVLASSQPKNETIVKLMYNWIGDGLLLSHGEKWLRNRKLLTPAFHFDILKSYMEAYNSASQVLIDKWGKMTQQKSSIEMFDSLSLLTLDILLRCTFGYESNCQLYGEQIPYIKATFKLSRLVVHRSVNPLLFSDSVFNLAPSGRKFNNYAKVVHEFSRNVINARRKLLKEFKSKNILELREKNKGASDLSQTDKNRLIDFLDILLMARDADGEGLTDLEIQHEVDTFMFAGHDTTSSALSWLMYNLARHPDIQQRCRDEVNSIIQSDEVTWENLPRLEYLTRCIKESLRLRNPVPFITRTLSHPVLLPNNITLPKDLSVSIAIDALHHSPDLWTEPDVYDPDRFLPENFAKMPSHAFLGFSAGPRNCIGQNFAMNEMKVCASLLLKHFEFSVDESIPVVPWFQIVLHSKDGIWLNVKPI